MIDSVPSYLTINLISRRCNIRCKTPRIKNRIEVSTRLVGQYSSSINSGPWQHI